VFPRDDELLVLGNIIDISMGGVCVRYLSTEKLNPDCRRIKLFGSNDIFIHLDQMDCNIVHDKDVSPGALDQLDARMCGVRFYNMSSRQADMLREFIHHFSLKENINQLA